MCLLRKITYYGEFSEFVREKKIHITQGYPHESNCQWEFTVDSKEVESVSVICDHINIVGNFFGNCEDGDYLSIRRPNDDSESTSPGRLCGDLSSWIPMNSTIFIDQSEDKQRWNLIFF